MVAVAECRGFRLPCLAKREDDSICRIPKFALSVNKAGAGDPEFRPGAKFCSQGFEQGQACGSEELSGILVRERPYGNSLEKPEYCWRWRRQNAVQAVYLAVCEWQRACYDLRRAEKGEQFADCADVENAVQGAHFMKMDLADFNPVRLSLTFRQQLKTGCGQFSGTLVHIRAGNDREDVGRMAMSMFVRKIHCCLPAADAIHFVPDQAQAASQIRHDALAKGTEPGGGRVALRGDVLLQERKGGQTGEQHVSGDAAMAAEGEDGARIHKRFTTLAAAQAPP